MKNFDENEGADWKLIAEQLDNLVAIVSGYKAKLMASSFSEEASEEMAVEFHTILMQRQLMLES